MAVKAIQAFYVYIETSKPKPGFSRRVVLSILIVPKLQHSKTSKIKSIDFVVVAEYSELRQYTNFVFGKKLLTRFPDKIKLEIAVP
jgi:hypothetical protein